MSHRLQVLIPDELDARIEKAAERSRKSKGAWVRWAIEAALERPSMRPPVIDPLARLALLNAPTADIEDMIAEVKSGRS